MEEYRKRQAKEAAKVERKAAAAKPAAPAQDDAAPTAQVESNPSLDKALKVRKMAHKWQARANRFGVCELVEEEGMEQIMLMYDRAQTVHKKDDDLPEDAYELIESDG